jgi:hypothetical protein
LAEYEKTTIRNEIPYIDPSNESIPVSIKKINANIYIAADFVALNIIYPSSLLRLLKN